MKKVKLGEVFDLQMGKTPARNEIAYWGGCNKWVSIADLSKTNKYIEETKEFITDKAIKESGIKSVPANTVIMSFKLSIGKTAITKEEIYTNEAIMAFIDKKQYFLNVDYLYHLFSSMDWSEGSNKAVLGLTLNKATLSQKYICIPSLEEQKEIADRLDKVSGLIEKRKTQLEKLDQLIKSRFIEMFGDCTNNTNNWAIVKLNDICDVRDGTHDSPEYFSVGVPLITSKNISSGYLDFSNVSLISKEDAEQINKRSKVDKGDVLLPMIGTVGGAVIIDVDPNFCIKNVALIKFTKSNISNIFVREYLNSDAVNAIFESVKNGGTQKFVGLGTIRNLPISIPPISLQNKFSEFVGKVDIAKGKVQKSIDNLETLKKSLMQQYFG